MIRSLDLSMHDHMSTYLMCVHITIVTCFYIHPSRDGDDTLLAWYE